MQAWIGYLKLHVKGLFFKTKIWLLMMHGDGLVLLVIMVVLMMMMLMMITMILNDGDCCGCLKCVGDGD